MKGPIWIFYAVFHDPVGPSSERTHNQNKQVHGIVREGRGWLRANVA